MEEINTSTASINFEIIKEGKHLCGIECAADVNKAFEGFINE